MSIVLRVLAYHRVAPLDGSPTLNPRLISATPEVFDRQMRHLSKHYSVVSLEQVIDALEKPASLPSRPVLVTFDDAYHDLEQFACPILRRHRLTATIFVPTAYPDHPERAFWWDRLHRAFMNTAREEVDLGKLGCHSLKTNDDRMQSLRFIQDRIKLLPHESGMRLVDDVCRELLADAERGVMSVLGWKQLRRLAKDGFTIAAHTRTHPILTRVSLNEVRQEVVGSYRDIEREIGNSLPAVSYPNGDHSDNIVNVVRSEGFRLAFTTLNGQSRLGRVDPLRLNRTGITPRTTPAIFRLRLLRAAGYLDRWRHQHRLKTSV